MKSSLHPDSALRRVARSLRSGAAARAQKLVRKLASRAATRSWLNALYRRQSFAQMRKTHARFSKLFRDTAAQVESGQWSLEFAGRQIVVPLTAERMWLDWDTALSVLGHDIEIKQTYAALLDSALRPDMFLDVGANYGQHTLLLLTQGVETISFEPNPECRQYIGELCAANHVIPRVIDAALGNSMGWTELWYPDREAWLGTTDPAVHDRLAANHALRSQPIEQRMLDEWLDELRGRRVLIKIDTEGSELSILQGATRLLAELRPPILFESIPGDMRADLFDFFVAANYQVAQLPWLPPTAPSTVSRDEFVTSAATNFVALPIGAAG